MPRRGATRLATATKEANRLHWPWSLFFQERDST